MFVREIDKNNMFDLYKVIPDKVYIRYEIQPTNKVREIKNWNSFKT